MQRFPDGIDAGAFYEKKVPSHFPDWVPLPRWTPPTGRSAR
jgi:DNA primase